MIAGVLGLLFGLAAVLALVVSLIPFLGWLNWITSLPLAFVGLILSRFSRGGWKTLGTLINVAVIIVALLRLLLGGGVI
ncbi:MAG: hypothetical protein EHM23_12785 [Acidobacteria bacterium]|nr:MAG: hypothetical protein EHM23_12785 [Acidobacteriota bacterium]